MKDTVFILGAGASMPYGLPSGDQLISRIGLFTHPEMANTKVAKNLHGNFLNGGFIFKYLRERYLQILEAGIAPELIDEFWHTLRYSDPVSIDNFLDLRPEFTEIGKLAIAHGISMSENPELLFEAKNDHWYKYLWHTIGDTEHNFQTNRITIITFNYDRSLDYYLYNVIKNSFNLNDEQVEKYFDSLQIYHVYGSLGSVFKTKNDYFPYSTKHMRGDKVKEASLRIKTIHEYANLNTKHRVQNALNIASRIYFLGFGYHEENMEILNITKSNSSIYGTAYGLTDKEIDELKINNKQIDRFYTCNNLDLLSKYVNFK